jgi:hypothetical protein
MNINNTAVRNRLAIDSLSALIFIKSNGPHSTVFNPGPYVERWLKEDRHSASDAPTGKHCKPEKNCVCNVFTFLLEQ